MSDTCADIESQEGGKFSVRQMCRWVGVARSWFLAWRQHRPTDTDRWHRRLTRLVVDVVDASAQTYGYRRVAAEAAQRGMPADPHTIRRIMCDNELVAVCSRKPGPRSTIPSAGDYPDLLRRDFTVIRPGVTLVGDITCIRTRQGCVYLATVLDCCTKKVAGHALGTDMKTPLIMDAMRMAARNTTIVPGVTIFHSDCGTQYMSSGFADYCDSLGVRRSVGRTGICYDNAWAESFNATLKVELVNRTVYPTRGKAITDVTRWIELRYNQVRLHSAFDYRTPQRGRGGTGQPRRTTTTNNGPENILTPGDRIVQCVSRNSTEASSDWFLLRWSLKRKVSRACSVGCGLECEVSGPRP